MDSGTLLLILVGLTVAVGIVLYNRLITLRNRVENAFSQIDVQLQRRYELIPNLVETARVYLEHERETLTAVTEARNTAEQRRREVSEASSAPGAGALGDPRGGAVGGPVGGNVGGGALGALAAAEQSVAGAMGRFNLVMEAYPELKADQRLSELHEDIASTENRVGFARQAYSDAVMTYNTAIEQVPSVFVARLFRFDNAELFEAATPEVREAVTVSFARA